MKLRLLVLIILLVPIIGEAQRIPTSLPQPRDTSKVAEPIRSRKDSLGRTVGSSILDDSTRNIYGAHTTRWISEDDLFYNRKNYQYLDTSLYNFHRWTYVQKFDNFFHDLGNNGTALNPIFGNNLEVVGARSGFYAYDPYYTTEEPQYFNTLSPFTRMYIVWGGDGRAATKAEFTRNINPSWNFGFNYRPILTDRQFQRKGKGDRQTVSHYYDAYTSYQTPNQKYLVLFSFRRIRHEVRETGGVIPLDSTENQYDPNAKPNLSTANSIELKRSLHLFQQFAVSKIFQPYLISDYSLKLNEFFDVTNKEDTTYFDHVEIQSDTANDLNNFNVFQNEIGFKGNVGRFFYNGYSKFRNYEFSNNHLNPDTLPFKSRATEIYFGGRLSYTIDSASYLTLKGESFKQYYQVQADFHHRNFQVSASSSKAQPAFIHSAYRGAHDSWINNFNSIKELKFNAFYRGEFGPIKILPGLRFHTYNNYIYFRQFNKTGQQVLPTQSTGIQSMISPELRFALNVGPMVFRPQIIYTEFMRNDDNAIRIPKWFVNAQLAFERHIFKGSLEAQIGFDFHWKSDYYAMDYDPIIQQFYVQDARIVRSYMLTDFFLNGKMKNGRFFIKYHNIFQLFTREMYYTTPLYPGMKNILDFGFDILLFD